MEFKIVIANSEEELNTKISEIWQEIIDINISAFPMHDLNMNDGSICNQWIQYIAVVKHK